MTAVQPVLCEISTEPLSVDAHQDAVVGAASGAVVVFSGVVRDHDHGRPVVALEYVGHPSAAEVLEACRAEILADPRTLQVDDIIARTEYALAGRFATIRTVAELTGA